MCIKSVVVVPREQWKKSITLWQDDPLSNINENCFIHHIVWHLNVDCAAQVLAIRN